MHPTRRPWRGAGNHHTCTSTAAASILLLILAPTVVFSLAAAGAEAPGIGINTPAHAQPQPPQAGIKYWPDGTRPGEDAMRELKRRYGESDIYGRSLESVDNVESVEVVYVRPMYVRKLPPDEGAKFWSYSDVKEGGNGELDLERFSPNPGRGLPRKSSNNSNNNNKPISPPFTPHRLSATDPNSLFKRQFTCPENSYACTSISAPSYCCRTDQRCTIVEDTGLGTIGCCPTGQLCVGPLTGCTSDQVTCSQSQGGGCCIKGYKCSTNGCIPDNAQTVTATPSTRGAQTTLKCGSGWYACPSELAGGCCLSGRACGVELCPATETPNTSTSTNNIVTGELCPTGFYSCAARYNGGCCRVGRDCGMTNCPARTSGTESVTIGDEVKTSVVATGTAGSSLGVCQKGWHSCPPSFNGGCCPTGYDCGVTNCPANTLNGGVPVADETKAPFETGGVKSGAVGGAKQVLAVWSVVVGVVMGVLVVL